MVIKVYSKAQNKTYLALFNKKNVLFLKNRTLTLKNTIKIGMLKTWLTILNASYNSTLNTVDLLINKLNN